MEENQAMRSMIFTNTLSSESGYYNELIYVVYFFTVLYNENMSPLSLAKFISQQLEAPCRYFPTHVSHFANTDSSTV